MIRLAMHRAIFPLLLASSVGTSLVGAAASSTVPLAKTTWVLRGYGAKRQLTPVLPATEVTVVFDPAQGRLAGSAGCNQYFAAVKIDGDRLTLAPIGATKKFCGEPPGVMNQEGKFLALLQKAERFKIRGNRLTLFSAGRQLLRFRAR
jgi:heat shock protein HslJ